MERRTTFSDLFQQNPALLWALLLVGGIATAEAAYARLAGAAWWLFLYTLIPAVLMFWAYRWGKRRAIFLLLELLTGYLLGMALLVHTRDALRATWPSQNTTLRGIVRTVKTGECYCQTTIALSGGANADRRIRATLVPHGTVLPQPGDELLLSGTVEMPRHTGNPDGFDYATWLRRQGISGTLFCDSAHWRATGRSQPSLADRALRYRARLLRTYENYFGGRDLAILSAMTLGEKSQLTPGIRNVFSETGTSHILALSGLHLGILFSLYNLFCAALVRRRRARRACVVPGLLLIWAFALLAGTPVSLVRSAVMFSLFQLSLLTRSGLFSLNNLALAACALLMLSPQALFDVGFQLSFLSVLGILLFMPYVPRLPRADGLWWRTGRSVVAFFYALLAVSLCTQAMTFPLVAYHFHNVPLYGLVANVVVVPLAYPLLLLALLFFLIPPLQPLLAAGLSVCLRLLQDYLGFIASWPHAALTWFPEPATLVLYYATLLLLYAALSRHRARLLRPVGLGLALCFVVEGISVVKPLPPQIVIYDLPHTTALHAITSRDVSYLYAPVGSLKAEVLTDVRRTFWRHRRIREPQSLTKPGNYGPVSLTPHVLRFGSQRVGLLHDVPRHYPHRPLRVDYLLISGGYDLKLTDALRTFSPKVVVLAPDLTSGRRRRLATEAAAAGLPCHDVHLDGALCIRIPNL